MSGTTSPYSKIYAFGDSLSDAGDDSVLTSATGATPVSPPYFHTNYSILGGLRSVSATVFSNGPVWVQDLSSALGNGALSPSLLGGNDFAYGGGETGSTPQNSGNTTVTVTSLPAQLTEFNTTRNVIAPDALITLSIGANDIFDILDKPTLTAAQQATDVADAVANEISFLQSLANEGAKSFLVFNVPNLGLVPEVTQGLANNSNTPSAALNALATSLSASYDAQLATALATLSTSTGTSVHILDAYSLIGQAAANPAAFGLANTTTPVWSGSYTSASSGTLATTSLAQQNTYLFWDHVHPTAAVHQILANTALTLVGPNPTTQATVTGAGGAVLTVAFASAAVAASAQLQFDAVTAGIAAGTVVSTATTGGSLPAVAAGTTGLAEIDSGATTVSLPAGYGTAVDVATGPVSLIAAAAGNHVVVEGGSGALLYSGVSGADTVYAGSGNALLFGNAASLDVFSGAGAASIVGGSAGNTVTGGGGAQLIFATSTLSYNGGSGAATLVGGNGVVHANLGAGGGIAFGGSASGNTLVTGSGTSILVGGSGNGDVLTATGAGNDVLVAGSGAETLNGAAGTGSLVLFGGTGVDSLVGGSGNDLLVAGAANETLTGGAGTNAYVFAATPGTARTDLITDFDPTRNAIGLYGYGSGADAAALASATTVGGTTSVSLSDGTHIVFANAATLHSYNFF